MSMCVLGMAEEFREEGVAVNALWPRTAIWTAAMRMLGGDPVAKVDQRRKPKEKGGEKSRVTGGRSNTNFY